MMGKGPRNIINKVLEFNPGLNPIELRIKPGLEPFFRRKNFQKKVALEKG